MMRNYLGVLSLFTICSCTNPRNTDAEAKSVWLWSDQTSSFIPETAEWTNRVEVADINEDGLLDLLFANGGNYSEPGDVEPVRVFLNAGPDQPFKEVTDQIFSDNEFISRVIKTGDLNHDGIIDILVGATYQTRSRLFYGQGNGTFQEAEEEQFPKFVGSVGDIELGDVDMDGDLDLVFADWGPGNNMENEGGLTRLLLNDGSGGFSEVTAAQMPAIQIKFSWDLEFVDIDNDFDLDIAVSCKRCETSRIYINDGKGIFTNEQRLPAYTNNYDFEFMDLNGDGFLDATTINDGDVVEGRYWLRKEHVFLNDSGYLVDMTDTNFPSAANVGEDDNNVAFLDYDSDGDADFLISSLTGEDRLLINDGTGVFTLQQPVLEGDPTPHTLSLVLADVNNDQKLDIVMGQGEGTTDLDERIFLGTGIKPDTSRPVIGPINYVDSMRMVFVRIHDYKSPNSPADWSAVDVVSETDTIPMQWFGEYLWRAQVTPSEAMTVVAIDRAGNKSTRKR